MIRLCNHFILSTKNRVHTEPGIPGKPRKCAIFTKSQGKPGIVREFFIIFIQAREKSGKAGYLGHILFSSSLCKVVFLFVVSKCEFYHRA